MEFTPTNSSVEILSNVLRMYRIAGDTTGGQPEDRERRTRQRLPFASKECSERPCYGFACTEDHFKLAWQTWLGATAMGFFEAFQYGLLIDGMGAILAIQHRNIVQNREVTKCEPGKLDKLSRRGKRNEKRRDY